MAENSDLKRRLEMAEESLQAEKAMRIEERKEFERKIEAEKAKVIEEKAKVMEERAMRIEAEKKLKVYKDSRLKSFSYAHIFKTFIKESQLTNCENLNLPQVDMSKLISAWDALISELPEFGEGKDEKAQVHPFIKKMLKTIIKTFNLVKIKFHYEPHLQNPNYYPDFCLTSSQISEPSWQDCLSFVECKSTSASNSEGGGQAISYMMNMLFPNIEMSNLSNIPEITFSTQTNGRSIQFFVMKKLGDYEFKKHHSSNLNFFNDESEVGVPSDGFQIFCRFLSFLEDSSIQFDEIDIKGKSYKVIKTYQKSIELIVGLIDVDGDGKCVAKCAIRKNKSALFTIRKEAFMYKVLKDSTVKTLALSSISDSNHLVFKDVGIYDLKSWSHYLLYERSDLIDDDERFERFVRCFIKLFDEIEKLHEFGYTHCDIRPANVLILEGDDDPCLIDFVTATEHDKTLNWFQGTLIYMAKDLLYAEKPFLFKRRYDMESFCYSILDCADKHFSDTFLRPVDEDFMELEFLPDNEYFLFANLREKQLLKLRENQELFHFPNQRFVNLFFSFYDKLMTIKDDLKEEDYGELKNILEGSIL